MLGFIVTPKKTYSLGISEKFEYITNPYIKTLALSGTGNAETDYILPLRIHYGSSRGDDTGQDVFLDSKCKTSFSDIRFTDTNENNLDFYVHSHGNYEIIPDKGSLGRGTTFIVNGKMITSNIDGVTAGIAESSDNGKTWTILRSTGSLIYVSEITGYYFAYRSNNLYRSIDSNHITWTSVIDMSDVEGLLLSPMFCEDANGTIFVGRYQGSNAALMWRSLDGGETFEIIYDATGDDTKQHFHSVRVDPVTGYVYGGVDGASMKVIMSTNASGREVLAENITWSELVSCDATDMLFGNGFRLFVSETVQFNSGNIISSVIKTEDDEAFVSELLGGKSGRGIGLCGDNIYLTTCAQYGQRYPQILQRQSDESWKTIYIDKIDSGTGNDGYRYQSEQGIPTGETDQQLIFSVQGDYPPVRIFDGGNHYQALVYVKIPILPADGGNIQIRYGGNEVAIANESIFSNITQSELLAHYKLNEGTGTTILDSSGNNKHGILVPGTGEWIGEAGRQSGNVDPAIKKTGYSFSFNGDGYIQITDSDTDEDFQFVKNFSVCFWLKSIVGIGATNWIMGIGEYGVAHWALVQNSAILRFNYNALNLYKNPSVGWMVIDNSWKYIAFSIDDDFKLTFCINGVSQTPIQLDEISVPSGKLTIGADSNGGENFTGSIDDVQIYNTALTGLQMRQIYEDRFVAEIEPNITGIT